VTACDRRDGIAVGPAQAAVRRVPAGGQAQVVERDRGAIEEWAPMIMSPMPSPLRSPAPATAMPDWSE